MKRLLSILLLLLFFLHAQSQRPQDTEDWSRKPAIVTPGSGSLPPSDAIVLYQNPGDLEKWESTQGGPAGWTATEEALTVKPKTGSIRTKEVFGDMQLHLEWRTPSIIEGEGQGRGNSGVFPMGLYEIQVLDSYENETYYNGQAGSIYKQHIPLVNACRPPGKWQSYDIIFKAPVFDEDGQLVSPAYSTVIHNGVLIQNHVAHEGPMQFIGKTSYKAHPGKLPLMLQNHKNPVSFRNIWVRPL